MAISIGRRNIEMKHKKSSLGIVFVLMALFGLFQGYILTGTIEGLLIGLLLGILLYFVIMVALIPIAGVFFYVWIADYLMGMANLDLSLCFYLGLAFAIITTGIMVVICIIFLFVIISAIRG